MVLNKFVIILKLIPIAVIAIFKRALKYGKIPNIIVSIDVESKFKNKVETDEESFQSAFILGCKHFALMLKSNGHTGVFFINITEYINGNQYVKEQISTLIEDLHASGHQIGIHIHPSLYPNHTSPDFCAYSETEMNSMLLESILCFEKIINERPKVFRAGGYSAGDWSKLYRVLTNNQVYLDSSVFPGARNLHKSTFNFQGVEAIHPFKPSANSLFKHDPKGLVTEIPITVVTRAKNNMEASFFRFDLNRPKWLLRLLSDYLRSKDQININAIYHSKEVVNDGKVSKNLDEISNYLDWIAKHGGKTVHYTEI